MSGNTDGGSEDWTWTVGSIVGVFGVKGELKVNYLTDFPERFRTLTEVCLRTPAGGAAIFAVESSRPHGGQELLKLAGIDQPEDIVAWRGALVQVRRQDAMPLEPDSFYSADLVGLDVVMVDGRAVGVVDEVLRYPAHDLLRIGESLIPAVRAIVVQIDMQARRIVIDPPAGLLAETPAG